MQFKGETNNSQPPFDSRRPDNANTTCNCCTEDLARLIRRQFRRGDPIGVTFIGPEAALVFIGVFLAIEGTVLVISDLFIDDTVSTIPLCDIASIEMGCALANITSSPMSVAPGE